MMMEKNLFNKEIIIKEAFPFCSCGLEHNNILEESQHCHNEYVFSPKIILECTDGLTNALTLDCATGKK